MSIIREENTLSDQVKSGVVDIDNPDVRDNINSLLMRTTNGKFLTPYIGFVKVSKVLANFHIFLEQKGFMEGDIGMVVIPANQFGDKYGMRNDGSVVSTDDSPYSVFFEWQSSDCGMVQVFCQLVDEEELDEILVDVEAEANDETEDEEMNEEKKPLITLDIANRAKKEAIRRKEMADKNPSGTSKRFSDLYDKYSKIAQRAIDKKMSEETTDNDAPLANRGTIKGGVTPRPSTFQHKKEKPLDGTDHENKNDKGETVVEGNLTNKRKKNEALRKYIESKKPENAVKTKTKAVRNALKGPTVNQFDIRNLKIAEENDYEVIYNGKTTKINAPSSSEAQRKAEKKFGLKPKFKHKGMTIARKTVKEENDYEVIYNGKTTKINAPSSSEAQTKAEKEFGLKPKFKHKGMTIAPKTMKEEELDEGISKMIKNVKRGLKGWPSAGLDPKEANKDRPKDVVRRAKQIAKDDPKMAEKIAKSETGKGSPADLQRRVIQKALTKK